MQLNLPIFPAESKAVNTILSVMTIDDFVYYFVNGNIIRTHLQSSHDDFKFHIADLISLKICKKSEVVRFFGVSIDLVTRACALHREEGARGFYKHRITNGTASQMGVDRLQRIQKAMEKGESQNSIAQKEGISEGTIRYNITIGKLKKK
jgi:hypothetical protein